MAQQSPAAQLDSLLSTDLASKSETDVLKHKLQIADLAWRFARNEIALRYAGEALADAIRLNNKTVQADAHRLMGIAYTNKGDYESALSEYQQAQQLYLQQSPIDTINLARTLNNMGLLFHVRGYSYVSTQYFHRAMKLRRLVGDSIGVSNSLTNIGRVKSQLKDYDSALFYYRSSYEIRVACKDTYNISSALGNMGDALKALQKTDSAIHYYQMAYQLAIENKADYNASFVLASMSQALIQKKDYSQALRYALLSDSLSVPIQDWQRVRSLNAVGEAYIKLGNLGKAEAKLLEALETANNSQSRVELVYAYKALYQLDSIKQNYQKALRWHVKYKNLHDSIRFSQEISQFLEMQIYKEIREKDDTLNKFEEEQRIQRIKEQNSQLVFVIIGSSLVVLLILIAFLLHTQRRLQQKNIQLSEKQLDIERINAQLSNVNQQLKQQNETLAELSCEKDGLMGIMAHDLRSPLSGIKGLADVFRMSGNLNAEQLEYLNLMDLSIKRGTALIDDILLLNERQEKQAALSITEENFAQLIDKNLHIHRNYAAEKNIRLVWNNLVEGGFYTDAKLLLRILDNLLSNAIKFTFPGKEVHLTTQWHNNNLRITVADQGQGIAPDERHKLFKKFSRLRSRPTNGEASTGLGLAIVKQLVDELQGSIEVVSQPDEGSTFILTLPNLNHS